MFRYNKGMILFDNLGMVVAIFNKKRIEHEIQNTL